MSALALPQVRRRVRARRRRRRPPWWHLLAWFGLLGCAVLVGDVVVGWTRGVLPVVPGAIALAGAVVLGRANVALLRDPPVVLIEVWLLGALLVLAATLSLLIAVVA